MDLCPAVKRRPETRFVMRWWEKKGLDLEGMRRASQEADHTEGAEEREGTETTKDN